MAVTIEQAEVKITSLAHEAVEGDETYFLVFTLTGTIAGVEFILRQTNADTNKMTGGKAEPISIHDEIEDVQDLLERMFSAPYFTVGKDIISNIQGLPSDQAQMLLAVKNAIKQKILQHGLYLKELEKFMKECNEFAAELVAQQNQDEM